MGYAGLSWPPDRTHGEWSYNEQNFRSKYEEQSAFDCWIWQGSAGKHGALFGAYKNQRQQMTQAKRIAWMLHTDEDCADIALKMQCRNNMCVNPGHMQAEPNRRRI